MKNIGLFFGTFNPIHVGHLIIANYMTSRSELDEVWLVVTPQNPLKDKQTLLSDYHRLAIVQTAIEKNDKLKVSDIEFKMSQPNYTIDTLVRLKEKHPNFHFHLIIGEDNLRNFHKWKNAEIIQKNYSIFVYPRVLTPQELENETTFAMKNEIRSNPCFIYCDDAPLMKISSTYIREEIRTKKDVRYLLTEEVYNYVDEMNFYK
jgi:nicotinate-nucleotide adenylyltransferase